METAEVSEVGTGHVPVNRHPVINTTGRSGAGEAGRS